MDRPGLLERSEELGVLHGLIAQMAAHGRGGVVLVAGEAGIGKTALLREFCGELPRRVTRMWGACDPLFIPRPLGPLLEPAAELGGEPIELLNAGAKPFDVGVALAEALGRLAPVVLVIEDMHWADEATLDVLRVLARRSLRMGLLLVLSYRSDQLDRDHPLRMVLGELPSDGSVTRLELTGFSRETVVRLAATTNLDAEELFARTAGNPFFVTETLAAQTDGVPETVSDAVHARLAGLQPSARALLDAVAVIPQQAEIWLLEALSDGDLGALDDGLRSGVLRAEANGVIFRHELARLAVEASLPPDRAVVLHRRALAALADPTLGAPDYVRLAHHAEAAGDRRAMLTYAPLAGERAAERGSPREAQHHYWRALRFAHDAEPGTRVELLERFYECAYLSEMRSEAVGAVDEAIAIHRRRGDIVREGRALRMRGRLLSCIGRVPEAAESIAAAVRVLEQAPPSAELARAYGGLAGMAMNEGDVARVIALGDRAIAMAEQVDDLEALVTALNNVGTAQSWVAIRVGRPNSSAAWSSRVRPTWGSPRATCTSISAAD